MDAVGRMAAGERVSLGLIDRIRRFTGVIRCVTADFTCGLPDRGAPSMRATGTGAVTMALRRRL